LNELFLRFVPINGETGLCKSRLPNCLAAKTSAEEIDFSEILMSKTSKDIVLELTN